LGIGFGIDAQCTRLIGLEARGAAVAGEVALLEDLYKLVLAMALHRAGVADASGVERFVGVCRWRIAGEAGVDVLP
jgi:hypothetical protein